MPSEALVTQNSVYELFRCYINQRQRQEINKIHEYCIKLLKTYILDGLEELLCVPDNFCFLHGATVRRVTEGTTLTVFCRLMQFLYV